PRTSRSLNASIVWSGRTYSIASHNADGSRPAVPIVRDQRGAGAECAVEGGDVSLLVVGQARRRPSDSPQEGARARRGVPARLTGPGTVFDIEQQAGRVLHSGCALVPVAIGSTSPEYRHPFRRQPCYASSGVRG